MTKHLTVGFDGSPESYGALRWAAEEAVMRSCALRIVQCYSVAVATDPLGGWIPTEAYAAAGRAAAADVENARDLVSSEHQHLDVSTVVRAGSPADVLLESDDGDEELIVLGAGSHRGASALLLGSTPRAVVRRAKCPVVVVRGLPARVRSTRVVVGVDGSDSSREAVLWAAGEADLHGVDLHLVHAWDYPYEVATAEQHQARDLTRVDASCVLQDSVALARDACRSTVVGEVVEGGPVAALVGSVHEGDLLVLGSRGRGALRASMFGSTVNGVLDEALTPVVVVRHGQ
ncbi:MAG TPA: universal stress protein [Ilumatobacteraceae bacterium]